VSGGGHNVVMSPGPTREERRPSQQGPEQPAPGGERTLSLKPVPAAARLARAWVESLLEGWPQAGRRNASLVVSELVTNAVLHARTPIVLSGGMEGGRARFEVHDEQRGAPVVKPYALDSITGRGMALVNMLVDDWGVTPSATGKAVWCVVSAVPKVSPPRERRRDPAGGPAVDEPGPGGGAASPSATVTVSILRLPLSVYYEAEEHNDAVMRELTLIEQSSEVGGGPDVPHRLLALAAEVQGAFVQATPGLRAQVERARAEGRSTVDLELQVPRHGWEKLLVLATHLDELDRYSESGDMLTFASPSRLRRFRRWYAEEVARQVRGMPPSAWPETD
jgi:anti-sigma regulatory factor (Ser/Thr protein kinase)